MPEMPEAPRKKEEDVARDFQNQESEDGIVPVDAKSLVFYQISQATRLLGCAKSIKKLNFRKSNDR